MRPLPHPLRWLLAGCCSLMILPVLPAQKPPAHAPAFLALDNAGHLTYLNASGDLIQRTRIRTSVPIESFLDLEVLDFLPESPGPEVVLLRTAWWMDVMPLPAPRQDAVARLRLLRFTPRTNHEPVSLSLASEGPEAELSLRVFSRPVDSQSLAWLEIYPPTAPNEGRGHTRLRGVRWPAVTGWTTAVPGLLTADGLIAGFGPEGVEVAQWSEAEGIQSRRRVDGSPTQAGTARLRLVRDRLYLLENGTTLHRWQADGSGGWKSLGQPLRLRSPAPLLGIVPLQR